MSYRVTFTTAEWEAIQKWAEEECNRFANWIADDFDKPNQKDWVKSVRARRAVLLDIRQALIDGEVI